MTKTRKVIAASAAAGISVAIVAAAIQIRGSAGTNAIANPAPTAAPAHRVSSTDAARRSSLDTRAVAPGPAAKEQPQAFARARTAEDAPVHHVPEFDEADVRLVATGQLRDGSTGTLYMSRTPQRRTCLVFLNAFGGGGGGCNTTDDPFVRRDVFWTAVFVGGPEIVDMSSYVIVGTATARVQRLEVADTAGTEYAVPLSDDRAFLFEEPVAALRSGARPATLRAYGAGGRLLDTLALFGANSN